VIANIVAVPAGQDKVFDVADPDLHGKVVKAGPEVSEVRFDDDAARNIPNDHLRPVDAPIDDELTRSTHPEEAALLHRGREAWDRLRTNSTWKDWKAVGKACAVGQATAMHDAHVNKPKGRSYNAAFSAWQKKFGFEGLDRGVRSRLLDVMKHLAEIDAWLAKLPPTEQQKINHPNTVWRRWKAATAVPDPNAPPKVSPYQKLSESVAALQEENDRMRREIERGGGDLWNCNDRPRDIARIVIQQCKSKTKAEKVAREMLRTLNNTSGERAALEEQIEAVRQRAVKEHVSSAEWADVDRMRKRVKWLQEMGR
jgi:hypothetical protein